MKNVEIEKNTYKIAIKLTKTNVSNKAMGIFLLYTLGTPPPPPLKI